MGNYKYFYIMGKSASGKDTVFRTLLADSSLCLKRIVPYTTRPIRAGEVNDVDYHFKTDEEFNQMVKDGAVIEYRTYTTKNGNWTYFTPYEELEDGEYITIGTPESYAKLKEVYKDNIIPIYIELDNGIRLQRALDREKKQKNPKYAEMCRRFLADEEDFSEEKLRESNITIRVSNESLNDCVNTIKNYILSLR